jgi:hypothetical protein
MIWIILLLIGSQVCVLATKYRMAEASIVYKKGAWSVSVDDGVIGRAPSLNNATDMLYQHGYKVHTYRRAKTASDKVKFDATVLCFTPKEEE